MGRYTPTTPDEREKMLATIGVKDIDDLYVDVPKEKMIDHLDMPAPKAELEVRRIMTAMAAKNKVYPTVLRGAGSYRHYIPSIVKYIPAKEEFETAYTPYQAEISQGVLQSIFEYQTLMCELTGMEVSNAGVYDGASASAEAVAMCIERNRTKAFVASTANPEYIATIKTYCFGSDVEVTMIPSKDGVVDADALTGMLGDDSAYVYVQQPNFFGLLEDVDALAKIAHTAGAKLVECINPIAAIALKTPFESGADVAVGEGQPLGMPMGYGGPYLGFMTTTSKIERRLPGRIVGQTTDVDGKRAFVLTLQAREQHIRREKASSNICSNEALCALTAGVYLATMGPDGMKDVAEQCYSKAHYLADELCKAKGVSLAYKGEFFHEFVTTCGSHQHKIIAALDKAGILAGLPLDDDKLLWCVTEVVSKDELDKAVAIVKEVCA